MSDNSNASSGGIGFIGLLTIVFITLRLTNYIDWSWWWVLSPVWLSIALPLSFFIVFGGMYLVGCLFLGLWKRRQ
jgi:hypothetical protein